MVGLDVAQEYSRVLLHRMACSIACGVYDKAQSVSPVRYTDSGD